MHRRAWIRRIIGSPTPTRRSPTSSRSTRSTSAPAGSRCCASAPDHSGYLTIASALKRALRARRRLERRRAAAARRGRSAPTSSARRGNAEVAPLMELFARALRELGSWLEARHQGSFRAAVAAAEQSAERFATSLAEMPLFRDVARYAGAAACRSTSAPSSARRSGGRVRGPRAGALRRPRAADDLRRQPRPHVLRREGVLVYTPELADAHRARSSSCRLVRPRRWRSARSRVHAVELAVPLLRERGIDATPQALDHWLWNRGQSPEIKAHPRHRSRSPWY